MKGLDVKIFDDLKDVFKMMVEKCPKMVLTESLTIIILGVFPHSRPHQFG